MKTLQTKFIQIFSLLLVFSICIFSSLDAQESPTIKEVDIYVNTILERNGIPGAAVAVLQKSKIIHENYYGQASIEFDVPVTEKSIFRVYSLTKVMVSNCIFKLIEDRELSLDDKAAKYLTDLPKDWKPVKIKHLLSHSSGLPEFDVDANLTDAEANTTVYSFPIQFEAGDHFDYNQTNYWLLTRIIETVTDKSMEEYLFQHQFPNKNKEVLFSSNSLEIIPNRVTRYSTWNERGDFQADYPYHSTRAHAGNGLNISLREFIKWSDRFDNNDYLKEETRNTMWSPFPFTGEGKTVHGHGWGIYPIANQNSYGFTGGGATGMRKFKDGDLTIIWLTNGAQFGYSIDRTINYIAGIVDEDFRVETSLANEYLVSEMLEKSFASSDFKESLTEYEKAKAKYPKAEFEGILNSIGYVLMAKGEKKRALEVFKLNVKEHPAAFNPYDSLAECHASLGDKENAIINYKKSVELNPLNQNGIDQIEKLSK